MPSTPRSLLERLRQPADQATVGADWAAFVELFTPLLCRVTPGEADAADLVQDVFVRLLRNLPEFQHDGRHRFRDWLHAVLVNCRRDQLRRRVAVLAGDFGTLSEPAGPDPAEEIAADLHLGRTFAHTRELENRIAALTPDDVKAAFRKYIEPKKLVIVRAGDFKKNGSEE